MNSGPEPTSVPTATILVCSECRGVGTHGADGEALLAHLAAFAADDVAVAAVPCFAVCDRPVTVAFEVPGKWRYVIGDLQPDVDGAAVVRIARAVAASPHGIPAMAERPEFFRNGVICRLPPQGWRAPQPEGQPCPLPAAS